MPAHSKFTKPVRDTLLAALRFGSSRSTACAMAGIDTETLRRWLRKGAEAAEGGTSAYRRFHDEVLAAEAHPKVRALGIVYSAMEDKPELAWKFVERREHGFAPPMPVGPGPAQGPVVIQLTLADGRPLDATTTIEIGDDDVPDEATNPAALPAEPTPIRTA